MRGEKRESLSVAANRRKRTPDSSWEPDSTRDGLTAELNQLRDAQGSPRLLLDGCFPCDVHQLVALSVIEILNLK